MPLRDTIVGAASGVVLLAGVLGFAVGLPEVVDDEPQASTDGEDKPADSGAPLADLLPDTLLNGAVERYSALDPRFTELFQEAEQYGADQMTEAFGKDVAVGVYATPDEQIRFVVTLYDGESGLFVQTGPPVPPEMSANSQTYGEYLQQGESVCFAQWQTQTGEDAPPFQVQCQRVAGGKTINVYTGAGVTPEQAVDLVDDVASQAGLA